jgi:hypothetical protein
MTQRTERVFELHWRQLNSQQWRAVLTDPETKLQYHVTSKLAFRTVLANLATASSPDSTERLGKGAAEDAESPR